MDCAVDGYLCSKHSQTSNSTQINRITWMKNFCLSTLLSLPRKQIFYLELIKFLVSTWPIWKQNLLFKLCPVTIVWSSKSLIKWARRNARKEGCIWPNNFRVYTITIPNAMVGFTKANDKCSDKSAEKWLEVSMKCFSIDFWSFLKMVEKLQTSAWKTPCFHWDLENLWVWQSWEH